MKTPRKSSRQLMLSFSLLVASTIAACGGGGGDPSESPIALSAPNDGRVSIASAFASTTDLANTSAVLESAAIAQESTDLPTSTSSTETASGASVENDLTDTLADLSSMPAPSAGPLSMSTITTSTSNTLTANPLISTMATKDLKAIDFNRPPLSVPRQVGTGSASLTWKLPTTRADGLAVGALSGYRIYYGTASGVYASNIFVAGGNKTAGSVGGLGRGTWYFAVTTVDVSGNESGFGYEMSKSL